MIKLESILTMFPSPLEVDRFISDTLEFKDELIEQFPSPLEVDRFISPYLVP